MTQTLETAKVELAMGCFFLSNSLITHDSLISLVLNSSKNSPCATAVDVPVM